MVVYLRVEGIIESHKELLKFILLLLDKLSRCSCAGMIEQKQKQETQSDLERSRSL